MVMNCAHLSAAFIKAVTEAKCSLNFGCPTSSVKRWKSLYLNCPFSFRGVSFRSSSRTPGASLEYTKSFVRCPMYCGFLTLPVYGNPRSLNTCTRKGRLRSVCAASWRTEARKGSSCRRPSPASSREVVGLFTFTKKKEGTTYWDLISPLLRIDSALLAIRPNPLSCATFSKATRSAWAPALWPSFFFISARVKRVSSSTPTR